MKSNWQVIGNTFGSYCFFASHIDEDEGFMFVEKTLEESGVWAVDMGTNSTLRDRRFDSQPEAERYAAEMRAADAASS